VINEVKSPVETSSFDVVSPSVPSLMEAMAAFQADSNLSASATGVSGSMIANVP
jgi:hypothetical protein